MARSMSKPFSHFSSTPWAFANPPTPLSAYTFADPPPPLIGEEKLILDIKIAAAIVVFMIFIVILIRKLRECNSGSGSSASEGGGVINSQVSIQLPAMNTDDDGSVIASAISDDELRHGGQRSHLLRFFVRFQGLLRKNVVFISRTDEHGEKIASAAAAWGSDPSEHCDVISQA
nr:methionine--trna ligase, chloroplastic/mitochondrial [Quercus suber]